MVTERRESRIREIGATAVDFLAPSVRFVRALRELPTVQSKIWCGLFAAMPLGGALTIGLVSAPEYRVVAGATAYLAGSMIEGALARGIRRGPSR